MAIYKVQQQLDKPEDVRKIKITSKPKNGVPELGDVNIIKKGFPEIFEALAGRPKAFFIGTVVHGEIRLYEEAKKIDEW